MSQVAARPTGAIGRMSVVAAAHVALVFVIANGFGLMPHAKGKEDPPIIDMVPVEQPQPVDKPKPLDDFKPQSHNRIVLPEPEIVPVLTDPPIGAIDVDFKPIGGIPIETGSAEPDLPIVASRVDPKHPLTRPHYPAIAIRDQIEGAVVVEVFVQANGRIVDARIVTSSGYDFFDQATLEEARRNWRMLPATRDGAPFAQWYRTRVVFKLTQR